MFYPSTPIFNFYPSTPIFFVFTVVSTQIWVKYGQTLNVGLKMREKKIYSEVISWVKILNYIFNPTFGFVHILPKSGLKQPSIV